MSSCVAPISYIIVMFTRMRYRVSLQITNKADGDDNADASDDDDDDDTTIMMQCAAQTLYSFVLDTARAAKASAASPAAASTAAALSDAAGAASAPESTVFISSWPLMKASWNSFALSLVLKRIANV